jgi:hypothetical protein
MHRTRYEEVMSVVGVPEVEASVCECVCVRARVCVSGTAGSAVSGRRLTPGAMATPHTNTEIVKTHHRVKKISPEAAKHSDDV